MGLLANLNLDPPASKQAASGADPVALQKEVGRQFAALVATAHGLSDVRAKAALAAALKRIDPKRKQADALASPDARAAAYRALLAELAAAEPKAQTPAASAPQAAASAQPAPPVTKGAPAASAAAAQAAPPVTKDGPPTPPAAAAAPPDIGAWLEDHEFAASPKPQTDSEPRVLLNGEDMSRAQAVQAAVDALHVKPEDVRRVIDARLAPPRPLPGLVSDAPVIGPGNAVPGIYPGAIGGRINPAIARGLELEQVDHWLEVHHFYRPGVADERGRKVMLDGQETTIEAVADRALAMLGTSGSVTGSFSTRRDVLERVRQRYVDAPTGPVTQLVVGYTLVPQAMQASTAGRGGLTTQHQFSFTITRAAHASNEGGNEHSLQGSVIFDDEGRIVSLQAGGQEAVVMPLLDGWVQVSGFVQVMATVNWSRGASGTAVGGGASASVGAQVLVNLPWPTAVARGRVALTGVQLGLQATAGVQGNIDEHGPTAAGGATIGAVVNIPLNLP